MRGTASDGGSGQEILALGARGTTEGGRGRAGGPWDPEGCHLMVTSIWRAAGSPGRR